LTDESDFAKVMLTKLRDLSVIDQNCGPVDITLLGRLTNLTKLALSREFRGKGNDYHYYDWNLRLTSLVDLNIHHNFSINDSYNLTPLVKLTRLLFTHLRATLYISSLTNLVELQLCMQSTTVRDQIHGLTALNKLTALRFYNQTSYDLWQQITALTNLLKLVDNNTITNSNEEDYLSLLTGLTKLTCLKVRNIRTNVTSLMHLTRLQKIEIHHAVDNEKLRSCLPYLHYDQ
jgi:hypothetical protein